MLSPAVHALCQRYLGCICLYASSPAPFGCQAILSTGCLRAPKPLAHGELPLGGSFLLMEHLPFIPFGQSIPEVLKHLAEGLAEMHLRDPPPGVQGGGIFCFRTSPRLLRV